ncbi:N-alpha-acetyltransferase 30A [Drosophila sulfurigaster albostrigata]|uniref:N-alpha-acetyltransferase 30A n=1 Tax=Drosophila sulfurigaster albostrigata TaxID=89887 RepID=UPI002D219B38|nr:N-alpha-acetyltransferase 30A [Drosophila sulfurigaster albostrigata]
MNESKQIPPGTPEISYTVFNDESQLKAIQGLIEKELSEPYSIYTYRYFVYNWPQLCILAQHEERYVGVIVCKIDHLSNPELWQGYIAMLAVDPEYRRQGIGSTLVEKAIEMMKAEQADEIALETEQSNKAALRLYDSLGFIREQRLLRYYINGVDALRLNLTVSRRSSDASLS